MNQVKVITTRLPSYLEVLLQENTNIKFVYLEKNKDEVFNSCKNTSNGDVFDSASELELTGTPLHVDLEGDDTIDPDMVFERPPNWSPEEAQQYPLTLKQARTFINNHLKCKTTNESIFAICDGSDDEHTVGLGVNVISTIISRYLVYIYPCHMGNDEETIDYMKKDHLNHVGCNSQIEIVTTKKYNLFGYNLKNCAALQNTEHNGNISIEVSTDESQVFHNKSNIKMMLQVVLGHNKSLLHNFWEELCCIQSYIKKLENVKEINETTIINSGNILDFSEITYIIGDLVNTVTSLKKVASEKLDLNNLRQLNMFDKLWDVFKHCETLSDLHDSFHFFFEEIAEKQTVQLQIWSDNQSAVGNIVNGIFEGKIAVPTLSFSQSLELLIELGLEKLKNDYIAIITNFSVVAKDVILKKWKELCDESFILNSNKNLQRRTRISINPKTAITDLTLNKLKLTFLYTVHTVSEFIFLYKENLPSLVSVHDCFESYCDALTSNFVTNFKNVIQINDFKQPRLCHFSCNIFPADVNDFIDENPPMVYIVRLLSNLGSSNVLTVFHFSEYPIFPPSVFEDYDIPVNEEKSLNPKLYCSKLVKYTDKC